ncbi:hypothetical protein MRBLMF1_007150 [Streptomyces ossamyceticus]
MAAFDPLAAFDLFVRIDTAAGRRDTAEESDGKRQGRDGVQNAGQRGTRPATGEGG